MWKSGNCFPRIWAYLLGPPKALLVVSLAVSRHPQFSPPWYFAPWFPFPLRTFPVLYCPLHLLSCQIVALASTFRIRLRFLKSHRNRYRRLWSGPARPQTRFPRYRSLDGVSDCHCFPHLPSDAHCAAPTLSVVDYHCWEQHSPDPRIGCWVARSGWSEEGLLESESPCQPVQQPTESPKGPLARPGYICTAAPCYCTAYLCSLYLFPGG